MGLFFALFFLKYKNYQWEEFLSYQLRHKANNETSKQRKTEALKRLQVVESFREANQRKENLPDVCVS